jgi:hypothetical protein
MDEFTHVMSDPIQRRFAIRFMLMIGLVLGMLLGSICSWWVTAVAGVLVLAYFGFLTYLDLKSANTPVNRSEDVN